MGAPSQSLAQVRKPLVYQEVNGTKQLIAAQYVLHGKDRVAGIQVGVQVAAYDVSRPLIIDPVLVYSTYLGGSLEDGRELVEELRERLKRIKASSE